MRYIRFFFEKAGVFSVLCDIFLSRFHRSPLPTKELFDNFENFDIIGGKNSRRNRHQV